jgi:hypothetical protein
MFRTTSVESKLLNFVKFLDLDSLKFLGLFISAKSPTNVNIAIDWDETCLAGKQNLIETLFDFVGFWEPAS